ncbi:MAG: hypothetical protein HFF90_06015 [Oscillibacter sp.]|nr:hypothetical protein [Oscillibacter sp.]
MTERQALIARKQAMLRARARLRRMQGIEVVRLYEEDEPEGLRALYAAYCATYAYSPALEPSSRLPHGSTESQVCSWLIETMGLKEGGEYFFRCGLWAHIRIQALLPAVESLWSNYNFLLAETDFSRILEAGFDSRDEDHYLIDIWKPSYH